MKIKELLNREVDLKTFFLTGPLGAIFNMFSRKVVKESRNTNICDQIMKGDLFEWAIDETAMGTRVAARIIVNKF